MIKNINKSKRLTIGIPQGTEIYNYIISNKNIAHWELLDAMVRQLPKSRANRASEIISRAIKELTELYPDSKEKWPLVRALICTQILGIEMCENGFEECKKRKLADDVFEELKKYENI